MHRQEDQLQNEQDLAQVEVPQLKDAASNGRRLRGRQLSDILDE
jgi:hypothetical protein